MKFSIVVPFYNVEKYITKCLESLKSQTYENFEVILVNDGSKENEEAIINNYLSDSRFKYFVKENGGVSDARNFALNHVTGDYLLFVDSDDYIEKDLLQKLNDELLVNNVDVINFGIRIVDGSEKVIVNPYTNGNKELSVKTILKSNCVDLLCIYAYKISFWKEHNFTFVKGTVHEDFYLVPIILSAASSIITLDYCGYVYLIRNNSIMTELSYENVKKKVNDFKKHYLAHKKILNNKNKIDKHLLGFSVFATIIKARELNDVDRKEYIKFIKEEKLVSKISNISFKRFLMKIYLYLFLDIYLSKLNKEFYGGAND